MTPTSHSGLSRRTLAKGSLWAAPVLVSSSAIPAYAASRCNSFSSNFSSGFSLENPVSGSLWVSTSNRIYQGDDGVAYFYAGTSATSPGGALVRHTGTFSSDSSSGSNLQTGCTYQVSYDISTLRSITGANLHPIMTVYLVSPSGSEVPGSRVRYSVQGGDGIVTLPLASDRAIRRRASGQGFSFTAESGMYRWVTEYQIPYAPSTRQTASGVGYSAPVFTAG